MSEVGAMSTIFTMILNGDVPGHIVYRGATTAAFLTIEPLAPGHTLVVPIAEVDHWIDLDPETLSDLVTTAHRVGRALDTVYAPTKVGMMIAGLEVPHVHIHLVPIDGVHDLDFGNARPASQDELAIEAARIRAALDG